VVVAGAGIAGLTVAGSLQRAGHDVTVLEEADELRTGGAAIAIWHNGAVALARMGHQMGQHGRVIDRLEIRTPTGRRVGWVDSARMTRRFGVAAVTLARSELLDSLAGELRPGTVRFGSPCRGVREVADHAVVELDEGETVHADLVIGADGHRSVVRRLFAPGTPTTPTGWASLQGLTPVPLPLTDGTTSLYISGAAGSVGLMPAGHGLLQWWFDVPWPPDPVPPSTVEHLRRRFAAWESPVRDLLELASDEEVEPFPHSWHRVPDQLHSEHVVLIGDAVHAIPPVLAQGANQSIEDAWVLTRQLASSPSVPVALARYQKERRAKMAALSRMARAPMLPLYGLMRVVPSLPERPCTFAWEMVARSCSSALPPLRRSR
jgi:FAD-dependent urate hydroxylase